MKLYAELRGVLAKHDYTLQEYADLIDRSPNYVQKRMTGRAEWDMRDGYRTLQVFNIPVAELPKYFPPGGKL